MFKGHASPTVPSGSFWRASGSFWKLREGSGSFQRLLGIFWGLHEAPGSFRNLLGSCQELSRSFLKRQRSSPRTAFTN
jgi:hypothetical protein